MKASDLKLSQTRILLWGPPGSGKTVFAGTLGPKLQIVDLDGNASSLATFKDKFYDQRREVDVVSNLQNDIPGQSYGLMNLKQYIMNVHKDCREGKYAYKALCIDSLTTLMDMAKRKVLQTHRDKNQLHDMTLSMGQYQFMFNEVGDILRLFAALPLLTILIAHEATNEIDNVQSHEVMIPGKSFPSEVRSLFPEILYCRVVAGVPGTATPQSRFTLQTVKSWDATARSCLNLENGFNMNDGLPALLAKAGVEI